MTHRPPDPDFTPISPNPFIVGNPVRGRTMFFGRESEFELVRNRFQHSPHGGLLVFCGERRSGKTSILFQILDQRLGPAFIPVLIDMQSMAVGSEVEFLTRLSEEIRDALGPDGERIPSPTFPAGSNCSAIFLRFVQDVLKVHPDRKLILLFDEYELFENKIDAGLLAEDVLHVLASLMENEPVFLIFTGSQHLEQRRQEYWKILGKSIYKTISYLERSDALNLIQKPVEGRVDYAPDVVEAIYRLSAGQAFYTQAIGQNLVDRLNDHHTRLATPEILAEVVDGIVNNPLPQMIFLWDGLDRDDKLVLALLAEAIPDETTHAGVDRITRHLRQGGYPLKLETGRIATTLEKLFKSEMLLRRDRALGHEYAFRMDLWRRWIKRQHSVWQVMREEKLEIHGRAWWQRPSLRWAAGALGAAAIVGIALQGFPDRNKTTSGGGPRASGPGAAFALDASPEQALIQMDGKRVGLGNFRDTILADQVHLFRLTAAGHADTEIAVRLAAGATDVRHVALRELFGALRIETLPSGAEVRVDGRPVGRSPISVPGLSAAKLHRIAVSSRGYTEKQQDASVAPNEETIATVVLGAGTFDVPVTTDPSGSTIRVDGVERGESPTHLALAAGSHRLSATRDGYVSADTTLVVNEGTGAVRLVLLRKPAGTLIVQGDWPASIYVDGNLIVEGVQNSRRDVAEGVHQVRVVLQDGKTIDKPVPVKSGELATYDYSLDTVTHRQKGP